MVILTFFFIANLGNVLQVVALFLGYILFLLRSTGESSPAWCYFLSFAPHYLFLAGYFWAFIFGVEVVQTLNASYAVNQKSRSKFIR